MAVHPWHVLELCAGAGGLGLGIELAVPRARGVAYVEREAAAAAKLVHRMETGDLAPAPVWSDLATFDARPWRGRVHCVASGDPCQGNSVAGKRLGVLDDRFLIDQVVRVVDECRPLRLFRENVPGNTDGQLAALIPPLERLGYRCEVGIFSSGRTGNSHRRERLIIMADADGGEWADRDAQSGGEFGLLAQGNGAGGRCDRSVDDAERAQRRALREPRRDARPDGDAQRKEGADRTGASSPQLALAGGEGLEGSELGRSSVGQHGIAASGSASQLRRALPRPLIVPGPTDSRWIDVLDRWPELQPALSKEEAESHLRRGFDALADRVDRLRLLGNGVDPVAAAYAWICLDARQRAHRERAARGPILMGAAA